jgi:hypothetical protein
MLDIVSLAPVTHQPDGFIAGNPDTAHGTFGELAEFFDIDFLGHGSLRKIGIFQLKAV